MIKVLCNLFVIFFNKEFQFQFQISFYSLFARNICQHSEKNYNRFIIEL